MNYLLVLAFLTVYSTLAAFIGTGVTARFLDPDRTVMLTVKVTHQGGKAVGNARVNVYQANRNFSGLIARPADYQATTNASGIAPFQISVKQGEVFAVTVEVSSENLQTLRRDLDERNLPKGVSIAGEWTEEFELSPRATDAVSFPTANIKVTVVDADGSLPVEGALVKLGSDALTNSQRLRPHQGLTGPDGSAIVAIELMSADPVENIGITISKNGYKEVLQRFEIEARKAVGKTVDYPKSILLRKAPTDGRVDVKITVVDDETGNGVPDTDVILDGPDYKAATTDNYGIAMLSVKEPGGYVVRLSQDNYWPAKDIEIRVSASGSAPDPIRIKSKPKKDAAGDTIEVIVTAREYADSKDEPRPLKNAAVSDGRQTAYTDAKGRATLRGSYDMNHTVTVTSENYETSSQTIPIHRPMLSNATGRAAFVLKPALNDSTPLRLIVEVVDDLGKPVQGAGVEFKHQGRGLYLSATNEKGERDFRGSDTDVPLTELRKGLTLDVFLGTQKVVENRQVPADLLMPSIAARRFLVTLNRDWSALLRSIEALEPRVLAWKNSLAGGSAGKTRGFIDTAVKARRDAEALEREINAAQTSIVGEFAGAGVSICRQASPYQLNIQTHQAQAKQKAAELEQKLDEATTRSKTCSTAAEAELIRGRQREAIRLLGEIGVLNKKAVEDRDALANIAAITGSVRKVIEQLKLKLSDIGRLGMEAAANNDEANKLYEQDAERSKSFISTQLTLKAELAVLAVKAEEGAGAPRDVLKRITAMEQILTSTQYRMDEYGSAQTAQAVPTSVRDARQEIDQINDRARLTVARLEAQVCPIETLDEAVNEIATLLDNSTFEIGLTSDLPKLADACVVKAAKNANTTTTNPAKDNKDISAVDGPVADENKPVLDPPVKDKNDPDQTADQTATSGGFWDTAKKGAKNVEDKTTKKPGLPAGPPASSGGFWDAAKEGTKSAKDAVNGTTPAKKPVVEEIPESTVPSSQTGSKTNRPPVVEEIPLDNPASNAVEKTNRPPVVEEIPEGTAASQAGGRTNRPPVVEEIPEQAVVTSNSSNQSSGNPSTQASSGGNSLPPNVVRAPDGNLQPRDGYEWATNDPKDLRVKKKEKAKDPNGGFWGNLGKAVGDAIRAGQGGGGSTGTGGGGNSGSGGGGGGQGPDLSGTWIVTVKVFNWTDEEDEVLTWRTVLQKSGAANGYTGPLVFVRSSRNSKWYNPGQTYGSVTIEHIGGGRIRMGSPGPDGKMVSIEGTTDGASFSFENGDTGYRQN